MSWEQHAERNRRAWNEIAEVRSRSYPGAVHPAAFFAGGGCTLDPRVIATAGDVRGRRLLHLMSATGEETLSWSVLGADAVGVDISDAEIAIARAKAAEAGLATRFVAADVGALPHELADGGFDLVYTATGVLVWIPDIDRWAAVVARALAPGGRFLLFEAHPVEMCLWGVNGRVDITEDYFDTGRPLEAVGWSHFEGAEDAREPSVEFGWTLGQVITALADAGLRIERLEEFPTDSQWRFGDAIAEARRLPGTILLLARNA